MKGIDFFREKGTESAFIWVKTLRPSTYHTIDIGIITNAAKLTYLTLPENAIEVEVPQSNKAEEAYMVSFINTAKVLLRILTQSQSNLFPQADYVTSFEVSLNDKFKALGKIGADKWFVAVGKDFAKKQKGKSLEGVASGYFTIKYGKGASALDKETFIKSFVDEAIWLIDNRG